VDNVDNFVDNFGDKLWISFLERFDIETARKAKRDNGKREKKEN